MNYLFTVCGRAGSKGCKNKNSRTFLGVPLIYYTYAAILLFAEGHSKDIVHICVNTDSNNLVEQTRNWSKDITIIPRTPDLAGDTVAKLPVIQACLNYMEAECDISYDIVIDLDITSPIRTPQDISGAIDKVKSENYDVVFSVTEARRNPYFNMVKQNLDGSCNLIIPSEITTRQQAPESYDMNASIYAYSPAFLRSSSAIRIFNGRCGFIKMPDTGILDIDSEYDFALMEIIAAHLIKNDNNLRHVFITANRNINELSSL